MAATASKSDLRREAVALLLAAGRTVKDAAREARTAERTIHYWRADDAFRRRVRELQAELFGRTVARLVSLGGQAADTLARLLDSGNEAVALGAARTVLEAGARLRETVELARRVEELEYELAEVRRERGN